MRVFARRTEPVIAPDADVPSDPPPVQRAVSPDAAHADRVIPPWECLVQPASLDLKASLVDQIRERLSNPAAAPDPAQELLDILAPEYAYR